LKIIFRITVFRFKFTVRYFQSNIEGELIGGNFTRGGFTMWYFINAAAYTHTSLIGIAMP